MGKKIDIADMKQRVAAAEAELSAAAQQRPKRDTLLSDLLDAVEKSLARKQRQNIRLEEEQRHVLEEVQQLRNLLHDMLTISETLEDRQAARANATHAAVAALVRMRSNWLRAERQSVVFSAESLLSDQELIERLAGDDPERVAAARTLLGVGEGFTETDEIGH